MPGRIVSKILPAAVAGYVFQEWTRQHFRPSCSWRTGYFLIKRWSLGPSPWAWRTVRLALTNRGSQSGAAWSPRLLENLVHFPVALSQECTSGAWISMEEVPLLWGHPAGETTESQRETRKVSRVFQPTSLWVSLPGTRHVREWDSSWSQPQLWWQKCRNVSQL